MKSKLSFRTRNPKTPNPQPSRTLQYSSISGKCRIVAIRLVIENHIMRQECETGAGSALKLSAPRQACFDVTGLGHVRARTLFNATEVVPFNTVATFLGKLTRAADRSGSAFFRHFEFYSEGSMRHLLLPAVLLLCASFAFAQSTPGQTTPETTSPSQTTPDAASPGQTTPDQASPSQAAPSQSSDSMSQVGSCAQAVQGCLSGTDGNYTLTDKNGNTYKLTGDSAKLSEHVGHEVQVSGSTSGGSSASASGASNDSMSSGASSQTIQVTSLKHIAKTCKSGNAMSH